jgi:hypothetical protein
MRKYLKALVSFNPVMSFYRALMLGIVTSCGGWETKTVTSIILKRRMLPFRVPCLLAAITVGGCGFPMKTYGPMAPAAARSVLHERFALLTNVDARATLILSRSEGQNVQMDAVLLMQPPRSTRLTAWYPEVGEFELTITPGGAWLLEPVLDNPVDAWWYKKQPDPGPFVKRGAARGLMTVSNLLLGGMFRDDVLPTDQAVDLKSCYEFRRMTRDGLTIVCDVDKELVVPTVYRIMDANGSECYELDLSDYGNPDQIDWPFTIVAKKINPEPHAAPDTIELNCHWVSLNDSVPDGTLQPRATATKLP